MIVLLLALVATLVAGGCHCVHDECGCCEHISWRQVHLNTTACLNITYIPSTLSISLTLSLGSDVILNKTVSASDPDICVNVPYLGKLVKVCLDFTNMTFSSSHLSGCADIELDILGHKVAKVNLGCFNIHVLANDAAESTLADLDEKKAQNLMRTAHLNLPNVVLRKRDLRSSEK